MYKIISHTADLGLEVQAESIAELFVIAAHGFNKITLEPGKKHNCELIKIELDGSDYEELLVNWLSELNYLISVKYRYVNHIDSLKFETGKNLFKLSADLKCFSLSDPENEIIKEIKAITFHDLDIHKGSNGFSAIIYFDI